MAKTRTRVYIDGFNLYYGCVKGTPYRWLNLSKLCSVLLPNHEVMFLRYFTSLVSPPPWDPQQLDRQQVYIRALKTLPNMSIHHGHFRTHAVTRPLASPLPSGPAMVEVLPHRQYSGHLAKVAAFYRPIRQRALRNCHFPPVLSDATGTITKPASW